MAKAKAEVTARFVTEVAPPRVVTVMRRRKVPRSLDTIAEDDREQVAYSGGSSSDNEFAAAARCRSSSRAQARERTGGPVRELSGYSASDADHGQPGGGWDWERESGHKLGHRRVV
ncbi:hypothetical protein BS78_04G046900 [Paspalum vaginatum]|nr:hypothetical protein BS78_04G046900 [Paspalum vaginatum]